MTLIFLKEIELLKEMILRLAIDVEDRLNKALQAAQDRDEEAARDIRKRDAEIDTREVRIEEECLKVLALHQPVASDLRFVIFVLKVDNELERIADLAVNIAKRVSVLAHTPTVEDLEGRIEGIAETVCGMLRGAIEAVVGLDADAASGICDRDEAVDALHREVQSIVFDRLSSGKPAESARTLMTLLGISKELERVGDHATNIAEDLIYLVTGKVVRHQTESLGDAAGNA